MTTNEKLDILRTAEEHAFLALRDILNLDAIADALYKILRVRDVAERIRYDGDGVYDAEVEELADEDNLWPSLTVVSETAAEEPIPEATEPPAPVEEKETPASAGVDKKEVRRKLAAISREKDIDIAPLMAQMGYSKFGDIPADRYAELLKLAEEA